MSYPTRRPNVFPREAGVVLIISLIILAVLSILGISTMRMSISELQVAGDTEDANRAFQSAQAGLDAALGILQNESNILFFTGSRYTINFSIRSPNPLEGMSTDTPTVEVLVSGDRDGVCARTASASSADILGCGAFEIVSTLTPDDPGSAKGGAETILREGVAQEVIKE